MQAQAPGQLNNKISTIPNLLKSIYKEKSFRRTFQTKKTIKHENSNPQAEKSGVKN